MLAGCQDGGHRAGGRQDGENYANRGDFAGECVISAEISGGFGEKLYKVKRKSLISDEIGDFFMGFRGMLREMD